VLDASPLDWRTEGRFGRRQPTGAAFVFKGRFQ